MIAKLIGKSNKYRNFAHIISKIMTFADILKKIDAGAGKKLKAKVPQWDVEGLSVPQMLNLEQSSSSATAQYKAALARQWCLGIENICSNRTGDSFAIADLTGGLGVDSWAFSRVFSRVLHNERDEVLSQAVRKNFSLLGVDNAQFASIDADDPAMMEILEQFQPDVVYMDPARRSATGKKVFLLEDCSPNVLHMLPSILGICPVVVLKLSPMADITMLLQRLGGRVHRIHVVECGGECKELLCLVHREACPEPVVCAVSVGLNQDMSLKVGDEFAFTIKQEKEAALSFAAGADIACGSCLFEPGPALMKAGPYRLVSERCDMKKLSADSHLYVKGDDCSAPADLGRSFVVEEVMDFGGSAIKACGRKYPVAEVSAKGIMMKSDELRSRLGVKSGGNFHIFGVQGPDRKKLLLVCRRT